MGINMEKQNTSIKKAQNDFKNAQIFITEKAANPYPHILKKEQL